jgi:prepilin-type N-terminal cleavage/methylation domain-containing protein
MKSESKKRNAGFSLIELMIAMIIMLTITGIITTAVSKMMGVRARESRTTDALTSAQAALNVMSRELSNSGFGIYDNAQTQKANNGIVWADSNSSTIHVRANITNFGDGPVNPTCTAVCTNEPSEDVTYSYDNATASIIRYDPHGYWNGSAYIPQTSVVVNKISNVTFQYYDYASDGTVTGPLSAPSVNTGRIELTVQVALDPVQGQPYPLYVKFISEINLRNSSYMLNQY